jgi:hypothetical protein
MHKPQQSHDPHGKPGPSHDPVADSPPKPVARVDVPAQVVPSPLPKERHPEVGGVVKINWANGYGDSVVPEPRDATAVISKGSGAFVLVGEEGSPPFPASLEVYGILDAGQRDALRAKGVAVWAEVA